jgi:hypothetical protein
MHVTPPLHRRRLDFFVRAFQFDTSFAEEVLGFHPRVNFARGALLTAAWYQDQGMLDLGDAPATPAGSRRTIRCLRRSPPLGLSARVGCPSTPNIQVRLRGDRRVSRRS